MPTLRSWSAAVRTNNRRSRASEFRRGPANHWCQSRSPLFVGRGEGLSPPLSLSPSLPLSLSPSLPLSLSPSLPLSPSPSLPLSPSPSLPLSLSPSLPLALSPSRPLSLSPSLPLSLSPSLPPNDFSHIHVCIQMCTYTYIYIYIEVCIGIVAWIVSTIFQPQTLFRDQGKLKRTRHRWVKTTTPTKP